MKKLTQPFHYDKDEIVERDVRPLLLKAVEICRDNGIPIFVIGQRLSNDDADGLFSMMVVGPVDGVKYDMSEIISACVTLRSMWFKANDGDPKAIEVLQSMPLFHAMAEARNANQEKIVAAASDGEAAFTA